jgi:hypothetical protein
MRFGGFALVTIPQNKIPGTNSGDFSFLMVDLFTLLP